MQLVREKRAKKQKMAMGLVAVFTVLLLLAWGLQLQGMVSRIAASRPSEVIETTKNELRTGMDFARDISDVSSENILPSLLDEFEQAAAAELTNLGVEKDDEDLDVLAQALIEELEKQSTENTYAEETE